MTNKLNIIQEKKGKEVFQQAKELKKIHIFKFMCNQMTYWDYKYALLKPHIFKKPNNKDGNYLIRRASAFYFSAIPEQNKKQLKKVIENWETYYKKYKGCMALGNKAK